MQDSFAQPESDAAIMRRVQTDEPHAFAVLASRYFDVLVRVAESRLGSREIGEDAAQEALLAAFKSRHTYNHKYGFRTWLWTILLNRCRREHKRSRRVPRVLAWSDAAGGESETPPADNTAPRDQGPVQLLLARESAQRLDHMLRAIREEEADALRLRFYAALTFQEIADAAGCSVSTAKNRVRAGLSKLAERMADEEGNHVGKTDNPPTDN